MTLSSTTMPLNGEVTASVTITNTGNCEGAEVVQLYIGDRVAKGVRPYKELRGFERITLAAGESKEVSFTLDADRMGYFDPEHFEWTLEPGEVEIMIGRNARETEMQVLTVE